MAVDDFVDDFPLSLTRAPVGPEQRAASVKNLEKHLRKVHPKWKVHKRRKQPKLTTPKWADEGAFKRGLFVQGGLGNRK
jgi:hypothetical protein